MQAESARIIIAGGGAIGLSVAYHLGRAGAKNVTLLEKNRLTSGTSWHAAGIVGPLRSSQNLTTLAKYGIELFTSLETETGLSTGYQRTGGLWLAQNNERLCELERIAAMGDLNGLHNELLGAAELRQRVPLLHSDDLAGALWVEADGQINPVDLCMAYAKGARNYGVAIREQAAVTGMQLRGGELRGVRVNAGEELPCDIFINCAGLWARQLGLLAGVNVPVQAVEHSYLVSEPLSGLADPCPIIRDLDSGIYIKGDTGKLVFGGFEPNARLWYEDSVEPDADYLLFAEDWDHVAPWLEAVMHRVPAMSGIGIQQFICGPESFTPDTRQVMGEASEVARYYVAAGFNSIGIMSSAGVGNAMAHWVLSGEAPMDLWEVDCLRFDASDNQSAFLAQRTPESVFCQFAPHWPGRQYRTGRGRKRSHWHQQLADEGAVFGAPTGWERPLWFDPAAAADSDTVTDTQYSFGAQAWWPYAEAEALRLQSHGALFDLSPMTKLLVSGEDALAFLQLACTRNIDIPVGTLVYTLMLNHKAGIEMECTLARVGLNSFRIVSSAACRIRDRVYLERLLSRLRSTVAKCNKGETVLPRAKLQDVVIEDITGDFATLAVAGPLARSCLQHCVDNSHSGALNSDNFAFRQVRELSINSCDISVAKISYCGDPGWELYVPVTYAQSVFTRVWSAARELGMTLAGHYCLDSCRLEKGYPHWGHDIGPEDSPVEAGLLFAVELNSDTEFIGRARLQETLDAPVCRRRVLLQVMAERPLLLHDEPIYRAGELVGASTSGGLGFRTGLALCMAMIDTRHDPQLQADYQVRLGTTLYPARILSRSPYDPAGSLPRA